jgi:hypothetical protein
METRSSRLNRRAWIQGSGVGFATLMFGSPLLAQEPPLRTTLRSMSAVTGTQLSDEWLEPTATLVSVILEDSKPLRSLELGAIEPATYFTAD